MNEAGVHGEALPPFPFRHRLIPAVHEVVPERFGDSGVRLCTAYAVVTALAANAALKPEGEPYEVVAGRVFVRVRRDLEVSPAVDDGDGLLFHAWAGRRHASGRLEVADLCTRHFNDWAADAGIPLEARVPRAVWAWIYGESSPVPEKARQLVRLSQGYLTLDDIYAEPAKEVQPC